MQHVVGGRKQLVVQAERAAEKKKEEEEDEGDIQTVRFERQKRKGAILIHSLIKLGLGEHHQTRHTRRLDSARYVWHIDIGQPLSSKYRHSSFNLSE